MFKIFNSIRLFKDIDAQTFANFMTKDNFQVLDVRSSTELRNDGEIEGNINIDFFSSDFAEKVSKLDKEKSYLVYCRSGNRSAQACKIMGKQGFNHLYNLAGGIGAWKQSGN